MTQFNPHNLLKLTYGEVLRPIFSITDKLDALQYKAAYIEWYRSKGFANAENIVNNNIKYYANYGSSEECSRICKLFDCN